MTKDELFREAMIFVSKVFEDKNAEAKLRLTAKRLLNGYFDLMEKENLEKS